MVPLPAWSSWPSINVRHRCGSLWSVPSCRAGGCSCTNGPSRQQPIHAVPTIWLPWLRPEIAATDDNCDAAVPADELARFGLTDRERDVLALLAAGRSNPEIARALFISAKTASVHVSSIMAKLGVRRRAHLSKLREI